MSIVIRIQAKFSPGPSAQAGRFVSPSDDMSTSDDIQQPLFIPTVRYLRYVAIMFLWCLKLVLVVTALVAALYAGLLGALMTRFVQTHAVYLHAFQTTGNKDLNIPEMFGFLRGQVTPFIIPSADNTPLHSWHILPIGLYRKHMTKLILEPSGVAQHYPHNLGFSLLHEDPEALLAIHFHGAGGNMGSGYRIPNYRALAAGNSDKIHVLTFDYRGFGQNPGVPNEVGLIQDAISVVDWALDVAKIPPSRILLETPVIFSGHIMIAPFVDVPTLVSTYKIAGTVPVLSPVAQYPVLFNFLSSHIKDDWSTKTRIAKYVRSNEQTSRKYRIALIHAEDDFSIPWDHTTVLFWQAVNATTPTGVAHEEVRDWKLTEGQAIGAAGHVAHWQTRHGMISEYLLKYGLHDVVMGAPIVSLAAMNIFEAGRDKPQQLIDEVTV
ncbi:hypothetical protein Q7P37_011007 [Cladosporium fusiforme]